MNFFEQVLNQKGFSFNSLKQSYKLQSNIPLQAFKINFALLLNYNSSYFELGKHVFMHSTELLGNHIQNKRNQLY